MDSLEEDIFEEPESSLKGSLKGSSGDEWDDASNNDKPMRKFRTSLNQRPKSICLKPDKPKSICLKPSRPSAKKKTKEPLSRDAPVTLPPLKIHSSCEASKAFVDVMTQDKIRRLEDEIGYLKVDLKASAGDLVQERHKQNSILPVVEYLQEEHNRLIDVQHDLIKVKVDAESRDQSEKVRVCLRIIRGFGLVAKDIGLTEEESNSDSFVEVFKDGHRIGKTSIISSLNPAWNEQFELEMIRDASNSLKLQIWDEDYDEDNDDMGAVEISVDTKLDGTTTEWYEVPPDSSEDGDASGALLVQIIVGAMEDPKIKFMLLVKEVERLNEELKRVSLVRKMPKESLDRNSLQDVMDYLKESNKSLAAEKHTLQELIEKAEEEDAGHG